MNEFAMLDHPGWAVLQQHIARNVPEYITFLAAVMIAAVCTMPEDPPKTFRDMWRWLRNTFQTAVPAARAQTHASTQTVTQTPTTKRGRDYSKFHNTSEVDGARTMILALFLLFSDHRRLLRCSRQQTPEIRELRQGL